MQNRICINWLKLWPNDDCASLYSLLLSRSSSSSIVDVVDVVDDSLRRLIAPIFFFPMLFYFFVFRYWLDVYRTLNAVAFKSIGFGSSEQRTQIYVVLVLVLVLTLSRSRFVWNVRFALVHFCFESNEAPKLEIWVGKQLVLLSVISKQ